MDKIKIILGASILLLVSVQVNASIIDRGGGLIYDTDLNVTWLQDANFGFGSSFDSIDGTTDGRMRWVNAEAWACGHPRKEIPGAADRFVSSISGTESHVFTSSG